MQGSISTVVTQGYKIGSTGSIGLVVSMGYNLGAAPPPPPPVVQQQPYGPALWGDYRDNWIYSTESPLSREEKKKKKELQQRIEAGIIKELVVPKELKQEVREVVAEKVLQEIEFARPKEIDLTSVVSRIAFSVASDLVLDLRNEQKLSKQLEALEAERKRIEEEEEEAEVLTIWMMQQ